MCESAVKSLIYFHKGVDAETQWKKAVGALQKLSTRELAECWVSFANSIGEKESVVRNQVLLAHYKMIFKMALKQSAEHEGGIDLGPFAEIDSCLERSISLCRQFRDTVEKFDNFSRSLFVKIEENKTINKDDFGFIQRESPRSSPQLKEPDIPSTGPMHAISQPDIKPRLDGILAILTKQSAACVGLTTRVTAVEGRLDSMDAKLTTIIERLGAVQISVAQTGDDVIQAIHNDREIKIDALEKHLTDLVRGARNDIPRPDIQRPDIPRMSRPAATGHKPAGRASGPVAKSVSPPRTSPPRTWNPPGPIDHRREDNSLLGESMDDFC
jgi:hypothetical protein